MPRSIVTHEPPPAKDLIYAHKAQGSGLITPSVIDDINELLVDAVTVAPKHLFVFSVEA